MIALTNARVYTGDEGRPQARALLLDAGRVAALSGDPRPAWDATRLDLGGRTVLPAWRDAHVHLLNLARQRDQIAFRGDEDIVRIAAMVRGRALASPPGAWILGRGWDQNMWDGPAPRREDLDQVAGGRPVALVHKDGHGTWANSAALAAAGVRRETQDPPGGRIVRDTGGVPTGLLLETAQRLLQPAVPAPGRSALPALLKSALDTAAAVGLCAVANIGTPEEFAALQELDAAGALPVRVTHVLYADALEHLLALGLPSGFGSDCLRLGGIKIFVDGSLGSQTAWLEDAYARAGGTGIVRTPPAVLREQVRDANAGGLAVAAHAIGDRAVRAALDAFEAAQDSRSALARTPGRNRIEHIQLARAEDFPRFHALDILASMQPRHATADCLVAEREWGSRCERAYAWESLRRAGATLAFGSDAPVESIAPLEGIHAAVTRQRPEGGPAWRPEQCLSLPSALRAYTVGAAAACADPRASGLLVPGAPADCVLLDQDPFSVPPSELLHLSVAATCVGGRWAYRAPDFPAD